MKQRKESENKGKERRRRERVTKGELLHNQEGKQKEKGKKQQRK